MKNADQSTSRFREKDDIVHPSHDMSEWRSTIVTLVNTPRFGSIRHCLNCEAEEAETVCGHAMHPELKEKCYEEQ